MIKELKQESNYSVTENGALGFRTSGSALVDFNYKISTLRFANEETILNEFKPVYEESPEIAMKYMFFVGDIRKGLGERKIFNTLLNEYMSKHPDLIKYIPEYSRWDYLIKLINGDINGKIRHKILLIINDQLKKDLEGSVEHGESISLLAKWLPTANGSNSENRKLAGYLYNHLPLLERFESSLDKKREYKRIVSYLREHLKVTEKLMCESRWKEIDFSKVPSKANLNYCNAFLKHDPERRNEFLLRVKNGEVKINSSVNTPYDIVSKYLPSYSRYAAKKLTVDGTLEEMWKALPDISTDSILPVVDTSGSMFVKVGNTTAVNVAVSIGIYLSEKLKGEYKDTYLTFGAVPRIVDFSKCETLLDKLKLAYEYNDCSNTNLEAVFDLILKVAIDNHMSQKDLPDRILVITDGEFDRLQDRMHFLNKRLFEEIDSRYRKYGYKLPKLVFWNVFSRTNTIPVKENENGVCLVSGMSTNIFNMVMSNKIDPYEIILEQLMSDRYSCIKI